MANVTFVCCTCKRLALFRAAMTSVLTNITDIHLVDRFLIVDDNSDPADLGEMQALFPGVEILQKKQDQRGHWISLNLILQVVSTRFLVYWEDDCVLAHPGPWISRALRLMAQAPPVHAVLLDSAVLDNDPVRRTATVDDSQPARIRLHSPPGTDFAPTDIYRYDRDPWPGYCLRPQILDLQAVRDAGLSFRGEPSSHMEYMFSLDFRRAGLSAAVLPDCRIVDIGNDISAYVLNGFRRDWDPA